MPVAAGLAWYIAHTLLGHHQPFFAPTAAAVSLSKARVLRSERALQLIAGVVLGIGIGAAVKAVAGPAPGGYGAIAIAVAAAIAIVVALALGGGFLEQGVLFVNESVTAAILMIAIGGSATAWERVSDALIGGGVALVMTVLLFPAAPVKLIGRARLELFGALRDTLADLSAQGREPTWALAAGDRVQGRLAALRQACSDGREITRVAPRRWSDRDQVRRAGEQASQDDLLAATVVSLAHAASAEPVSAARVKPALAELALAFAALAAGTEGAAGEARQHARKAQALAGGPGSDLVTRLVQLCASDVAQR
jgi:uncharacterized membrane protein YgaE (UPF0421/DUF939 family)